MTQAQVLKRARRLLDQCEVIGRQVDLLLREHKKLRLQATSYLKEWDKFEVKAGRPSIGGILSVPGRPKAKGGKRK